ncbi:MAG TPA: protein kinase [Planctomycetota bacterium]
MHPGANSLPTDDLQFAKLVLDQGLCSPEKVDECVSFIARLTAQGVTPVPRLAELLVRKGYLSPTDATVRPSPPREPAEAGLKLPPEAAVASRDPSRLLGKYVKISPLGAGGMGEVWKGWDRELGRWVALKFLHQSDPGQQARLRREAQTAAALNHPHIASVYEVGVKDGTPFIAMQYIEGQTLATFPRKDRRALVELIRDAALAVQHAHEQGVIHRDLKPANLMVENRRVFVMDFGLAKATSVDSSLSASGSIVGTPAYMSPEQARGGTGAVTPASDVYSLGATLYELLAQRPPFVADELYALLRMVVDQDPTPPRRIKASIDRDLETIVLKCLEKEPSRRYAAARELAEDLDRWLQGEPIFAHPPSAFYRARKFVLRRKALIGIGAAGLVAVAVAVGILLPSWHHERSLKELAPLRTQIAVLREWVRQPFRKPEEIQRALRAEIDGVSAYIARNPDLPQGHFVRAQARLYLGELPEAEKDVREAIRLDPGFLPAWTLLGRVQLENYAGLLSTEAVDPFKVGAAHARAVLAEACESLRRGRVEKDPRTQIEAWGLSSTRDDTVSATLADALHLRYIRNDREGAARLLDEAHRRFKSEEYSVWTARWLPYGDEKDARIRETIEIAPLYAPGLVARAEALADVGQLRESLQAFEDAIERDPHSAAAYIGRGLVRGSLRDYEGSIGDFTKALELDARNTSAYVYRGAARAMTGDNDGAIADCGKALDINADSVGALINRSIARRNKKDLRGALDDLARVHAINPKVPHAWTNQSGIRHDQNDLRGALEDVSRAIEADPQFLLAYKTRASYRHQAGDLGGEIEDLDRAIELSASKKLFHLRADLYADRSMARLTKGDPAGGLADAREACRLDSKGWKPAFSLGSALLAQRDLDGAIREYTRSVELNPKHAESWNGRAQAWLFRGRLQEVVADASRAVDLDPRDPAPLLTRAVARQRQRDFRAAEEDCGKALAAVPDLALAYLLRSQCRADLGRFPEAAADAEKAHGLFPPQDPQKEIARRCVEAYRAGKRP